MVSLLLTHLLQRGQTNANYVAYNAGEDGTLEKTNWMGTPWRQLGMGVWYQ